MKNKSLAVPYMLILAMISFAVTAPHELNHQDPLVEANSFEQNPTPESFNNLPSPTAENLLSVQNPTVDNFNYLLNQNPSGAAEYLSQRYNNEFAQSFYADPNRVGLNPAVDDTYFSGDKNPSTSRVNINTNLPSANKYFTRKYGATYTFTSLSQNFVFDLENEKLTNGNTVVLEDYRNRENIVGINVIGNIIEIVPTEGTLGKVTLGGDKNAEIRYDAETNTYSSGENRVTPLVLRRDASGNPLPEEVVISSESNGGISITGPAEGKVTLNNQKIDYTNRRGTLDFSHDGKIVSANAEIIAPQFYADGAFNYDPAKKQAQLWAHGDSELENVRNRETTFIYRAGLLDKELGVVTQGQDKDKNQVVSVRFDAPIESDRATSQKVPETVAQAREQLRQRAQAIAPARQDLKGSAKVTFGLNTQNHLVVTAVGPVEVGFYKENALLINEPFFRGIREPDQKADAEYELRTDGDVDVDVRGKAIYTDDQFGSLDYSGKTVTPHGGIKNYQEGSSIALRRFGSGSGKNTDLIDIGCFQCSEGKTSTIGKSLVSGNPLGSGTKLYSEMSRTDLPLEFVVTKEGRTQFQPSVSLGSVREQLNGKIVLMERYLDLSLRNQDSAGNSQEELIRLSKPSDRQGITLYSETFDAAGKKISSRSLDFTLSETIGDAIILTSDKNVENYQKLLDLVGKRKVDELSQLDFDSDKDLRKFIKDKTRIDISLIGDSEYTSHLTKAVRQQQEFEELRTRLQQEYGVQLDDNGVCVNPPNCARKIARSQREAGGLAYLKSAAELKLLQAKRSELDAEKQSNEVDQKYKDNLKEDEDAIKKGIRGVQRTRKSLDALVERRVAREEQQKREQEEIQARQKLIADMKSGKAPEGSAELMSEAVALGKWKKQAERELGDAEAELNALKLRLEHNQAVAAGIEYSPSYSPEANAYEAKQLQAKITPLESKRQQLTYQLEAAQEQSSALIVEHIADRPDVAGRLAVQSGEYEQAREIASSIVATEYDSDVALRIESESYLAEQGVDGVALAARSANEIQDPDVKKQAMLGVQREFLTDLLERHRQNEINSQEISRDFHEVTAGELGWEAASVVGTTFMHGVTAVGNIVVTPYEIATGDQLITFDDAFGENYLSVKQGEDLKRMNNARRYKAYSEDVIRRLGNALREQDVEEFDRIVAKLSNEGSQHTDAALVQQFHHDRRGTIDESQRREDRAAVALLDARKGALVRDTFVTDDEYQTIAREYEGTVAAQTAQTELDKGEYSKFLDHYGEIIIESSDIVLGATVVKGAVTAARLGAAAAKTTRTGTALVRVATTPVISAERAAVLTKAAVNAPVIRVAVKPLQLTGEVLSTGSRYLGEAFHTRGSIIDEAVRTGKVSNPVEVQEAFRMSDELGTGVLGRERFAERAVVDEYVQVARNFGEAVDADDFARISQLAPEVVEKGKKVQDANKFNQLEKNILRYSRSPADQRQALQYSLQSFRAGEGSIRVEQFADAERIVLDAPTAEAQRAAADIDAWFVRNNVPQEEAVRAVKNAQARVAAQYDSASVVNTAERVEDSLRQQRLARSDGAVPVVTTSTAVPRALAPQRIDDTVSAAEIRVIESIPSTPEMESFVKPLSASDDEVMQIMLEARRDVLAEGRFDAARQLDRQIIGRLSDQRVLDDIVIEPNSPLRGLVDEVRASVPEEDLNLLAVKPAPDLAAAKEEMITGKIAQKKGEIEIPGISPEIGEIPSRSARSGVIEVPAVRLSGSKTDPVSELSDTGRLDLQAANSISPTEKQIQAGRQLSAQIKFVYFPSESPLFQEQIGNVYRAAIQDQYKALKIPEFERQLAGRRYTLYEISMSSDNLKGLNAQSYELGTQALDAQHQRLVAFAERQGLPITTLQKTTFIALPEGTAFDVQRALSGIVTDAQRSVSEVVGKSVTLRKGVAESASSLMETRLRTRRSMGFVEVHGREPVNYNEVKQWFDQLPVEKKADLNDIFQGYDPALQKEFQELERLRQANDRDGFRRKVIQLAEADSQDARFSNLELVKYYLDNPATGLRKGDLLASIDGIAVGQMNKGDVRRLTLQNLPDDELARQLGRGIDDSIRDVNERIKEAYFAAVDKVNVQSVDVLDEYGRIAENAFYTGEIRNTDDLKAFLKWEFEARGRFRGGDEAFMMVRKEVLDANPKFHDDLTKIIATCGDPCGYNIRVGMKEVAAGEKFQDAIKGADEAVQLSKQNGNVPVIINQAGEKKLGERIESIGQTSPTRPMPVELQLRTLQSKVDNVESVKGDFDELLWTHNAPAESLEAILKSGYIRAADARGKLLKRGANFRYGLDSQFGDVKFVMKRGFERKYRGYDDVTEMVTEDAYFIDFFQKAESYYGRKMTREELQFQIARDYNFRRHLSPLSDAEVQAARVEAFERSYLNPQLQIADNVNLDDIEAVLVPEHLYDDVVRIARQQGFDVSKIRKVEGTGTPDSYYAYDKARGIGSIDEAVAQGVARPRKVQVYRGSISGSSSTMAVSPSAFQLEEQAYLKILAENQAEVLSTASSLSRSNPELYRLLGNPKVRGDEVMDFLGREFDDLNPIFEADAGVWEGFTIAVHNNRVHVQFNSQLPLYNIRDPDIERLLKVTIALHDIGKPQAIAAGNKALQHRFTLPILEEKLTALGFSPQEVRLARNLVGHDIFGDLAKGNINPQRAYDSLRVLAEDVGMDVTEFYRLQTLLYVSDASSYPALRQSVFTQLSDGRLVPAIRGTDEINPNFESLQDLIEYRASVLGFPTKAGDISKISSGRTDFAFTQFVLEADTIPGALENIRLGQYSRDLELTKAYRELRSSAPQTFSRETLKEVADQLDDMVQANWIHGTNSRVLPNLRLTKDATDDVALLPHQSLGELGIVVGGGELGIGTFALGDARTTISGMDFVTGNVDTTYHYARLRGGYDVELAADATERLELLLREVDSIPGNTLPRSLVREIEDSLRGDFQIFASALLKDQGTTLYTARQVLEREKAFLKQVQQFTPIEQQFLEEGTPIILSASRDTIIVEHPSDGIYLRGEADLQGALNLNDLDVIIYTERLEIPRVKKYLTEVLGISNPRVYSIESYDVLTMLTDTYAHHLAEGGVISKQELRQALQESPELRDQFKQQIEEYLQTLGEDETLLPIATELRGQAVVGQAFGDGGAMINTDLINRGLIEQDRVVALVE